MAKANTPTEHKRSTAYSRAANREKLIELVGFDTITFQTEDGAEFYFPHPMMYDKATKKALKPLAETDTEGIVRILLDGLEGEPGYSPGTYDSFVDEHDGDPDDVMETLQLVAVASQRAVREGTPLNG